MSNPTVALEQKIFSLFATELRRQGVVDIAEWSTTLQKHLAFAAASADTCSSPNREGASRILIIDLTNIELGDKVAVALCESLLKLNTPASRSIAACCAEYQLLWRRCGLTEKAVPHLELLVLNCPQVGLLDVSANHFSAEAMQRLLSAASEVPCDVIVAEAPQRTSHGSSNSNSNSSGGMQPQPHLAQKRSQSLSATSPDSGVMGMAAVRMRTASLPFGGRRPSPSLTATSASLTPSMRSYASGSMEALQRRKEELFGHAAAVSSSLPSSPTAAAAARPTAEKAVPVTALDKQTPLSNFTPVQMAMGARATPRGELDSQQGVVSDTAWQGSVAEPRGDSAAPASRRSASPQRQPEREQRQSTTMEREPFVERQDFLDLTANLGSVLDSVLDLSALMEPSGVLQHVSVFGGARTIWEVIEAYEMAVEQQMDQQDRGGRGGSVSPDVMAKLPAALIGGGMYNALTVLNISRNHLRELHVLPSSLLRLDVSCNDLVSFAGIEQCPMLTVLNARRNQLRCIAGLERHLRIAHLFLGHNRIRSVEGVGHLVLLETLDLTFNNLRTEASLRLLSLCSSLQHLLIRGNPIADQLKRRIRPVLRNLCPALLVVDDTRVGPSRIADAALAEKNRSRHPHLMDVAQRRPSSPGRHSEPIRASSSSVSAAAALWRSGAISPTTAGTTTSSMITGGAAELANAGFVASRPGQTRSKADSDEATRSAAVDERCMNVLHMITRGVTAPAGYGDAAKSHRTLQQMVEVQQQRGREMHRSAAGGRDLRSAVVKQLAEDSRRYLEETIVRRMTLHVGGAAAAASSQPQPAAVRPPTVQLNAYGGTANPEMSESPVPDALGYTTTPSSRRGLSDEAEAAIQAALLRRYAPRPSRLATTVKSTTGRVSRPSADGSGGPAAVRRRQESSAGGRRPPLLSTSPSACAKVQRSDSNYGDNSGLHDADATLEAMYVEEAGEPYGNAPTSYASLYAAEMRKTVSPSHSTDEELQCSPIGKDPHTRLITSLSSTSSRPDLHGNAHLRPTAQSPMQQQRRQSQSPARNAAKNVEVPTAALRATTPPIGKSPRQRYDDTAVYAPERSASQPPAAATLQRSTTQAWVRHRHPSPSPSRAAAPVVARPQSALRSRSRSNSAAANALLPSRQRQQPETALLQPLHIDEQQRRKVVAWTRQLNDDTAALQAALKTTVELLEAQRQAGMEVPESSRELPPTYLKERRRCIEILRDCGMLSNTEVPMHVVVYYGLAKEELMGLMDNSDLVVERRVTDLGGRLRALEVEERRGILRQVQLMGDAKTCLRYVAHLIEDGRERLLQQYVDQVKESL